MDGLTRQHRIRALGLLAAGIATGFLLTCAQAQVLCDTGNPCDRNDTASLGLVGPSTGANNPIDIISGNKYQAEVDFHLPGELGLSFTRHYNSSSMQAGALGGGWSHTYETALLRVERESTASITIAQGDGRRIEFEAIGDPQQGIQRFHSVQFGYGVVEEEVSPIDLLRRSKSANAASIRPWKWIWPDGRQLTFDGRGTLARVQAPSGEWIELAHDKRARLHRVLDFAGRELRLAYWDRPSEWLPPYDDSAARGAQNRLKSLTTPDHKVIHYSYDANGLLTEARFPDGTHKRYEYDTSGGALQLARIIGRDGQLEGTYTYDSNGHAISSESFDRQRVSVARVESSARGTSTSVLTNTGGASTTYRWKQSSQGYQLIEAIGIGCRTCPASNVRYVYDENGLVVRVERLGLAPEMVDWSEILMRDRWGRVTLREREQNGARQLIERYEYASDDPLARPSRIVRPSIAPDQFHTFEVSYNDRGQPLHILESGYASAGDAFKFDSIERSFAYSYYEPRDGVPHLVGRLKAIDGPLTGTVDRTTLSYDARGLLASISYSNGAQERFAYDALGRLNRYVPLDGVQIDLEYDEAGRINRYARAGLSTVVTHDVSGRIAALSDPIGQHFTFEYEGSQLSAIADSGNNRIEFEPDPAGRPVARRLLNPDGTIAQQSLNPHSSIEPSSKPEPFSPATLSFIRLPIFKSWATAADSLIAPASADSRPRKHEQVVDERGLASHYRFDDFGRVVSAVNPDAGALTVEYDEASRVIARRFGDGRSIHYSYDALGRLESMIAGHEQVLIEYGAFNKPERLAYSWGDERYEYDFAGRVVLREQRIDTHRFRRSYRYDDVGRLRETTSPDGTTLVYRYNASVHAKPGVLSSIERTDWFRSQPILTGLNEADDRYDRSAARFGNGLELERELDPHGRLRRFGTAGVALFELETDPQGRIIKANDGRVREFAYDPAGRLTRTSLAGDEFSHLAYDVAGNARIVTSPEGHALLRMDSTTNRLLAKVESDGRRSDYAYDAAGRTTSIGARTFEYDPFGRLARIFDEGVPIAEYTYNAFGERIRKVVYSGSTRHVTYFFYHGSKLTAEADQDGRITKQFVYLRDRPVAMLDGDRVYAVHTDWLGTPVAATDEHQRIVWRAELDSLNRVQSQRGAHRIDLRASNQYFDAESGLHYNLNRYFDPATSRYLTPDPIGQLGGLNLYAFANGDPINFVDPLGLQAIPADYDGTDRFGVFLRGAIQALPEALRDSVGAALQELLDPAALATAATIFAAWGLSQLTPFGWAADLLIVGLGFAFMGAAIVDLARASIGAYGAIGRARTIEELCAAGRAFARALTDAVLELAGGGGLIAAARRMGPNVAAQIRRMFGPTSRPPPPAPLPWTQEMLQRVTDGFGNQIRQFIAGVNHVWRPGTHPMRWISLEAAAISFARNFFHARYVINAKHRNGRPDPNATNGFDVVFVKEDGTLVIGEAKSGAEVDDITAFGGGARGERQLITNLTVLRRNVLNDPNIPPDIKDNILQQIDTRSFETHLYISPTTTIPHGTLDVFPNIIGRPLDAIYILPEDVPRVD